MVNDPHVQRIIDWRESVATLPDSHFFELIRMYLGEVKTPFNKQKLIEQLGSFLRKEEHRKKIVSLLSESDLLIICAVKYIPNATQEKLAAFFDGTIKFAYLYEKLLNLEERLIVYRHIDIETGKQLVSVNPMLEDVLVPFTPKTVLLEPAMLSQLEYGIPFVLSPEFIASVFSFIQQNPDLCKQDGSFKKKTLSEIERVFPGKTELLKVLVKGFSNLSLIREGNSGFSVDYDRLKSFAKLKEIVQYAYICVASQGRFSRSTLVRQARLLLDTVFAIPADGYIRSTVLRSAFLLTEKANDTPGLSNIGATSRFAAIVARAKASDINDKELFDPAQAMDRLIDAAVTMGFINVKGKDDKQNDIFVTGLLLQNWDKKYDLQNKVLSVDSGFTVSVMPGQTLFNLVDLLVFMDLVQFNTVAQFEINRRSIMRAFDNGLNVEQIQRTLKSFSMYELPQNLLVSIDDWSRSYSSATIYKGYILQVNGENSTIIEKNPAITPYIAEKLAPGIYLLNVLNDEQAYEIIAKSGLDFIGQIKSCNRAVENADFPLLMYNPVISEAVSDFTYAETKSCGVVDGVKLSTENDRRQHFEDMRKALNELNLTKDQREGLEDRIQRKIVLSTDQLRGDSVRFELREATGMDFSGKVHVIDSAIMGKNMVELEYDNPSNISGDSIIIVGTPLSIEKNELDSVVHIIVEPEHEEHTYSIGQAKFVKKMRGSVIHR